MGVRHDHGSMLDPPLERCREKREQKAGHDELRPFTIKARRPAPGDNGERGSAPGPPRAAPAHRQSARIVFLGFLIAFPFLAKVRRNHIALARASVKPPGRQLALAFT